MKVKVTYCTYITKEVEISDEFAPLADPQYLCSDEMCDKAIQAIENIIGMPFGDDNEDNDEYIVCVEDSATDEVMLEW